MNSKVNDFEKRFKQLVRKYRDETGDEYEEIKYSDDIYLHVASHLEGGQGCIELIAIIPHTVVDKELVSNNNSTLPIDNVPSAEEFYTDITNYIEDVSGDSKDIIFYLESIVDDGVWENPATTYSTFKIELE